MPEEISDPLLSLVKELGLVDDLQYEEVAAELKRGEVPAIQLLQDFGIMKLEDILRVMAQHLGTEVVSLRDREFSPELLASVPASIARMYHCMPVAMNNGTVQIALADPLDPARPDEIHFAIKKDVQVVVADPSEIEKAVDRLYGQETEDFSEILKELGEDKNIAREVSEAGDDARAAEALANEAPIVKFVNLVLSQAVQDRASDIHFEPFEISGIAGDFTSESHGELEYIGTAVAAGRAHQFSNKQPSD
jgi:type IV pilus assembly protein PilB